MKDYKKILEGVIGIIKTTEKTDIGFANICSFLSDNCDELFESEDERIRKRIIHALHGDVLDMEETTKALAWLEKQNELKTELVGEDEIEDEIYWLAWVIGRLPDTEQANEAEAVLKELLGKLEKIKARRQQ